MPVVGFYFLEWNHSEIKEPLSYYETVKPEISLYEVNANYIFKLSSAVFRINEYIF